MNYGGRALASLAVVSALLAASCGGRPSVASRSAAAYDDAKEKGVAIGGGHEHGGHAASATASNGEPAQMPGMDHSKMPDGEMSGMDHSKMTSGQMSGMDHAKMSSGPMSGMDHSKMSSGQMSGMDHSKMPGGQPSAMDHSKMQHGAAAAPAAPASLSTTEASRLNPSGTLTPDAFDSPAPTSVAEAIKAANNVPDGDIRHVVPGHDRENPPTPQPAIRDGSTERGGEGQQPQTVPPAPESATTGHAGHGGGTAAARPAVYACPMHPEVTSAEPGTCPKCGMALVEKK